jgi:putative selenium metabolism protein SsnA
MLVTHGNLITWESPNRVLDDHALYIQDGQVVDMGPTQILKAKYAREEELDARGRYVMPGSICAHTHFYGAFARGMAIPGTPAKDFPEILRKLWWPLDRSLDAEGIRHSVLPCLVDAVKHGTTTLFDHHASPNAIDGALDIIAAEADRSGLRTVLCYEVTDRDGEERMRAGIAENVRFLNRKKSPVVAAAFGLHASLTLSETTLDLCRESAPAGAGFHIHAGEHESDEDDSVRRSGARVVGRLSKHGILGKRSIAAHGVHFDADEIELLRESGTWLTHQPRSNMNNGVGVAPVESMLRAGVPVCLGNDGFSNAMWEEWKAAYLLHKVHHRDPRRMGGDDLIRMAVHNNGALASAYFPGAPIGTLAPGSRADIIIVDYYPNTPVTAENLPWHIVFGFQPGMVSTTIVAGRILMKERELLTLDEEKIAREARAVAPRIWASYEKFAAGVA